MTDNGQTDTAGPSRVIADMQHHQASDIDQLNRKLPTGSDFLIAYATVPGVYYCLPLLYHYATVLGVYYCLPSLSFSMPLSPVCDIRQLTGLLTSHRFQALYLGETRSRAAGSCRHCVKCFQRGVAMTTRSTCL